jgi:thiamine-monophosphate kinase
MTSSGKSYSEFEIIRRFFADDRFYRGRDVVLGPGDDCAIVSVPEGFQLACSIDTQVAGVHFPVSIAAAVVAYRSLGSSVSDLAAMGAIPHVFTVALTLPESDSDWLAEFSSALAEMSNAMKIALVGGDLTRGPLSVTIQVSGLLPSHQALMREGARINDDIYVSGTVGDARAGLAYASEGISCDSPEAKYLLDRYCRPLPRLELGQKLLPLASAAIDISDGLVADLTHIARMSGVGARLEVEKVPLSSALESCVPADLIRDYALSGGDDYELCFTAAPEYRSEIEEISVLMGLPLSRVGQMTGEDGVYCVDAEGKRVETTRGYQHFDVN